MRTRRSRRLLEFGVLVVGLVAAGSGTLDGHEPLAQCGPKEKKMQKRKLGKSKLEVSSIGLGCMRLSTSPDRDDAGSIAVIHTALDAGATLLDTADVIYQVDAKYLKNVLTLASFYGIF